MGWLGWSVRKEMGTDGIVGLVGGEGARGVGRAGQGATWLVDLA
jgi:hypothetical protein